PGPGLVGPAEFGHQVLLEDPLPVRRQVPFGRPEPGQIVGVHRVPPTRSPVTCSPAGPGSCADALSSRWSLRWSLRRTRDSRERTARAGTPGAAAASA